MTDAVETMAWKGEKPWHGLGVELKENVSVEEMVHQAGLDWTVSLRPIAYNVDRSPADGFDNHETCAHTNDYRALMRDSDGRLLDIVGSRYLPTQNEEAFRFFQEFVSAGDASLETAGSLKNGRMVWGLASLNSSFTLEGGDTVKGYLLLTNPHEQGKARVVKFTPTRVVCWNTLSMALRGGSGMGEGMGEFRQSHRLVFNEAQQKRAKQSLGIAHEQFAEHEEVVRTLAKTTLSEDDSIGFLSKLVNPELMIECKGSITLVREKLDAGKAGKKLSLCVDGLTRSPGAQLPSAKGTLWGAVNALTFAVDHSFGRGADQRLTKAWFGPGAVLKQRAYDEALKLAS